MSKRLAAIQSNYVPWKGYFDVIASVDEFVIYDDVQYTKNDWRNRNKIVTPQGVQWLSIPVGNQNDRPIDEVTLPNAAWQAKHWRTLEANYGRSPFFAEIATWLQPLYQATYSGISEVNLAFIKAICDYLGIETQITNVRDYVLTGDASARLLDLCQQAGADVYLSGPAAECYLDVPLFAAAGVRVEWMDYSGYPEYRQCWKGEFVPGVSILDVLFNCGPRSAEMLLHTPAALAKLAAEA